MPEFLLSNARIAIIGLGYVGLPLAVAFGEIYPVIGFDIDAARISALQQGRDATLEISSEELKLAKHLKLTTDPQDLQACNIYIVTVPTPIDAQKRPDLSPLIKASESLGKVLEPGDIVIYESTVYPGATEEICRPILEKTSGLIYNQDFYLGYSPERINPGDKEHSLKTIKKITSGSTLEAADYIDSLYASIILAGTYKAESMKIAEAAKVIENTQRDLNIALINELAIIFNALGIDTESVLNAAGTKWNFLPFRPGLVGGHCIGVDPYYLTHKAEAIGYHPEIILAGRRLNDRMAAYVAGQMVKAMIKRGIATHMARVLIMGLSFKENCPDLRNTKVIDLRLELQEYGIEVDIFDPWSEPEEAHSKYGLITSDIPKENEYDGIIVAVSHQEFRQMGPNRVRAYGKAKHVLYDIKHLFQASESDLRL
jgi:UDP-N-acetyl-D-glucosamine/UDP-N-acetyl-D-galactosamine dehydrogenase